MYTNPIAYDGNETEADSNILWEIPESSEKREMDNLWRIKTVAYTYSIQEIKFLLEEIIKTKQVIAGQSIQRRR